MKIAICDDDCNFRKHLEKQLTVYFDNKSMSAEIVNFSCGEELLESENTFDLVLMDIEMKKINGIETGRELKKRNPYVVIFIITSYDTYLDDAFRINAFRFLQKPVDFVRLYKALDEVWEFIEKKSIAIFDASSNSNIKIFFSDIIYIEKYEKQTKIVTVNGDYITNESLLFWKEQLDTISFVSPHASYIVNLNYAIQHTRKKIVLLNRNIKNDEAKTYEISIAPKKQAEVKARFVEILERG